MVAQQKSSADVVLPHSACGSAATTQLQLYTIFGVGPLSGVRQGNMSVGLEGTTMTPELGKT
eukprot:15430947-Alexandrium_andersonii.AAC.1